MSAGFGELARIIQDAAQSVASGLDLHAELGTVTQDALTGSDVTVQPDATSISLSWQLGSLVVSDQVVPRAGDRVLLLPISGGQIYFLAARLSKDPAKAVQENPSRVVTLA